MDGFYKDQFNIDKFLNEEMKKKELQSILKALGDLKQRNTYTMSNVLKEQTDSVVLIAEQLQSLYKKIDSLNVPILQLREEVKMLLSKVNDAVQTFDQHILQYQHFVDFKYRIQQLSAFRKVLKHTNILLMRCYGDSELDLQCLQRFIDNYALHNEILRTLNIEYTNDEDQDEKINYFLSEKFCNSFVQNDKRVMRIFIDMYIYLKRTDDLTKLIRNIIKPFLQPILCEENLRSCKSLNKLYTDALSILNFELLKKFGDIKEFNIVLDCYWVVVDNLLRKNLLSITAAGHADVFFTNFTETWRFLESIAEAYGDKTIVYRNASFVSHLKRFNLLVYYEIRHQEVSSVFETAILQCGLENSNHFYAKGKNMFGLKLQVSLVLYLQILYLIQRNIFLPLLSDQFLKSFLLLVSRYLKWIENVWIEPTIPNDAHTRDVLICIMCDLNIIIEKLDSKVRSDLRPLLNSSSLKCMESVIDTAKTSLYRCYNSVQKVLVNLIVVNARTTLLDINIIPRLYRRTNKNLPAKPSDYVVSALNPIIEFEKQLDDSFKDKSVILNNIVSQCTESYTNSCSEVFSQVCKTERSLLKLKSKNVQIVDGKCNDENSDISKIRQQIKLDLTYFKQQLFDYASDVTKDDLQALLSFFNKF